jgi:transcriptional regulator
MVLPEGFREDPAPGPVSDDSLDLLKGTLDVLVLKALTWGPRHGYAVARWLDDATHGTLQIEEGALYHGLHRLERRGWVTSEWGLSETNRRAKYYTLTAAGRQQLVAQTATWTRYAEAVFAALRTA